MKKFILLVIMITMCYSLIAQINISSPELVALQDPWGNMRPRIALNATNNPVIIWTNMDDHSVYCSVKNNDQFTTPQKLNPDGMHLSVFDWSGPEIASSGDNIAVVMKATPEADEHVYVVLSDDGGLSWSDTVRVENSVPMMSRMPSIGMDEMGNPYVAFMREDGMGVSDWALAKSTDGGETFEPAISVSSDFTDAVCDCCPSSVVVSGDTVVVLYRNNESNLRDIRASISFNSAESFSLQADMDNTDWNIAACPSTGPSAFLKNGKLHSAWMSDASSDSRIYSSSYNLPAATFNGNIQIAPVEGNVTQNYPSLAGDAFIQGIAWESTQSGARNVLFVYSTSQNVFQPSVTLELTSEMEGNQMRPHIAFADDTFHMVFTDNGGDAVQYMTVSGFESVRVNENTAEEIVSVYPNPASEFLTIESNGNSQFYESTIYDVYGNTIEVLTLPSGIAHLSLKNYSPGIYMIRLRDSQHLFCVLK